MKNKRRIIGVLICAGAIAIICGVVSIRRADAVIAIIRPAVVFTVNPGQTARIHVIPSPDYVWGSGRSQRMLLGFDVYRISETNPRTVGVASDTACVKYHMIERQACEGERVESYHHRVHTGYLRDWPDTPWDPRQTSIGSTTKQILTYRSDEFLGCVS